MRGDYYRGDYYRGDLFSGIKKIGAGVLQHFTGINLQGGPQGPPGPPQGGITLPTFKGFNPVGGTPKHFGGSQGVSSGGANIQVPAGLPIMRGYHMNKSKLGPTKAHPKGAAPHTVLVRNRHMNVANPRALARASRRAHGFLRMARKFVRYYTPKAPKGRAYIGKRRRSR